MRKPITTWYKQKWEFNHFEDGHVDSAIPTAKFAEQRKAWGSGVWKKKHAYLVDGKVVEDG